MTYTKTQKVAFNTVLQIVGKVVVTAISLVIVAALTRYLGIAGYGDYTTIFAYVSFWAVLADFGFFWVLLREISKPKADIDKIFNNIITLKIIFSIVVFLICTTVGFLIPQYSWSVKIGIAIISAGWVWMTLNSTYVGLFQSRLEMYKAVFSEVIGRIIILVGVLYFIRTNYGLEAILLVYIFGNFINFLISFLFGNKFVKFKFQYDQKLWKYVFKESFPLALLSFIGVIHFRIDTVILSILKGSMDVGIYGVPYKILEIIILIPSIFMGNVYPIFARYYHGNDKRFKMSVQKSFDFLIIITFPIVAGLIILSGPIINFIAGAEYLTVSTISIWGVDITAPKILSVLAFSIAFAFILNIYSTLLVVIEKQQKQVVPMTVVTIINLVLNIIFIRYYSYFAAALVNCCTNFIMLIWWAKITNKYLHFKFSYSIIPKVLLSTLIMGVVIFFCRNWNIILIILVGVFAYLLFAYLIRVFDFSMIKQFIPNFKEEK